MLKQTVKNQEPLSKQIQEDIQFLLSNIRARQNGLIFFLERFTSECKNQQQFTVFKQEFLQKQKIYANQVSRIINRYTEDKQSELQMHQYIRTFWIKIKSIIKVSLDRLRMLKLLNERIFTRYEEIIDLINKSYDQDKSLQSFSCIQNLLKKRNVDALIYSKSFFNSPISEGKINKNRSESAFKQSKFSPKPLKLVEQSFQNEETDNIHKLDFEEQFRKDPESRMKSLNRYRKKKIILQNKSKNIQKNYKKINRSLDKVQKCLEGAMDTVIQLNIDKKKTIKQNQESLYDELFNRNIPNHKIISKFLFGTCGVAQLFMKKKYMKNKKIFTSKTDKNIRESQNLDKKHKNKCLKQTKDKEKQKEKQKQKQRQKQKQKQKQKKRQSKQRPQSSLTAQIKGIFEQEKRRMIQTTIILQQKKNNGYRKKLGTRIEKYTKLVKLIS